MNTRCTRTLGSGVVAAALILLSLAMVDSAFGTTTISLRDIDSGLTSPTGSYRWLDVADQPYIAAYQAEYDYTLATVAVEYDIFTGGLAGTLSATKLKPNFAYQLKLVGFPGTSSNEAIGLAGRWWQEEWNGTAWVKGQNLNSKGDGTSPNPNDDDYDDRWDVPDATSPTGFRYKFTGYLLFDYFITDGIGDATLDFVTDSSYHVLWKETQRSPLADDGPTRATTFDANDSPAYADSSVFDFPSQTIGIYGEWERKPVGGVFPAPDQNFSAQIILTEESFHGGGGLAGNWAGAMGASFGFVEREGITLTLNGASHVFVGANFWYGINLAANNHPGGDRERLVRELDRFQNLGITNLRIMAGSEGPNSEPWRMIPALQTSPGNYDPDILDGLDFLLYAMKVRNLRAVMVLTNFWHWSGGMAQYVNWNGGGAIPYPPPEAGGDWNTYQAYAAGFYSNSGARDDYQNHIEFLVNHINPYTGLALRDDPVIMAWELANEPRGMSNAVNFNLWIDAAAAFIKSLDPNHLVTTGTEGNTPWPSWNGLAFVANHDSTDIDYATVHIWPQNWGWFDPLDPDGTYLSPEGSVRAYWNSHLSDALFELGKPLVLEEFGLARDGESYDPQASTDWRDEFFTAMYEEIFNSASSGGPAVGDNVWAWAGEGRPLTPDGDYWSPEDPWIGDPPHEKQGWYSIYDSDATTLSVISDHISDMASLSCDAQLCNDGLFCNGIEICDAVQGCQPGIDPCAAGETCYETTDICQAQPTEMHVGSVVTGTQAGTRGKKFGTATVTILDYNNNPVGAGFTITGDFSGSFTETGAFEATESSGVAVIVTSDSKKKVGVPAFCVSSVSGSLTYISDANADGTTCDEAAVCGNGIIEVGETCDGSNLNSETCENLGFDGGTLACNAESECQSYDTSGCTSSVCTLGQLGDRCAANADCCSDKCKGKPGSKVCK